MLTGKVDKPQFHELQKPNMNDATTKLSAVDEIAKSTVKFDLTDQLMSMHMALPSLNNNLENYLSWKVEKINLNNEVK